MNPYWSFLFALLSICGLYLVLTVVRNWKNPRGFGGWDWSPLVYVRGHNGNLSTSLFQNFLFTILIIFAFISVFAADLMSNGYNNQYVTTTAKPDPNPKVVTDSNTFNTTITTLITNTLVIKTTRTKTQIFPNIPTDLFLLMGFSVGTAVGSRAITLSRINNKENISLEDKSTLLNNREGNLDLVKVQMLLWTLVSAGLYLVTTISYVQGCYGSTLVALECNYEVPNIGTSLVLLMGISQTGYLAGKIVRSGLPPEILEVLIASTDGSSKKITIIGRSFGGSAKSGDYIIIVSKDGKTKMSFHATDINVKDGDLWQDDKIIFPLQGIETGTYTIKLIIDNTVIESKEFSI